ncbi:GntR family transcriptional regulator [Sphingobium sp. WW5]|jgi:DNA-binding GntR family transcriptional regulator|uniref:GntR family transcriptional regulator n=1 Tax=unclassified Sphingobium TaxID=2611147 RepID=UPI003C19F735
MAPEPITADYIYRRIRHEIVEGAFAPGAMLKLTRLTYQFGASATPVRDALNRLVGERLVVLLPGGGFRVRSLDADRLAGLYRWHGHLIQFALERPLPESARKGLGALKHEALEPGQVAAASERLFGILASVPQNEELEQAVAAVSRALARARALEHRLLPDVVGEFSLLLATIDRAPIGAARRAMARYHQERARSSFAIHTIMQP